MSDKDQHLTFFSSAFESRIPEAHWISEAPGAKFVGRSRRAL